LSFHNLHHPYIYSLFFFLTSRRPPTPPLFPYTTLFRSTSGKLNEERGLNIHVSRTGSTAPVRDVCAACMSSARRTDVPHRCCARSEEHTSELQSRGHLVCRLLLEKKKKKNSRRSLMKYM